MGQGRGIGSVITTMTAQSILSRDERFEALFASLAECRDQALSLELDFLGTLVSMAMLEAAIKWDKIDLQDLNIETLLRLKIGLQTHSNVLSTFDRKRNLRR